MLKMGTQSVDRKGIYWCLLDGSEGSAENISYFGCERFWLVPNSLLIFFYLTGTMCRAGCA